MLTSAKNQTNLPRYFAQVFDVAQTLENGRLHFVLDDGRIFRVEGRRPGPVAAIEVHNPDLFARLIRASGSPSVCSCWQAVSRFNGSGRYWSRLPS